MTGLELSRRYFREIAEPRLQADYPDLYSAVAAGLVGNGSECFGYDDEISRDHDWGADFYLWLPEAYRNRLTELQTWKDTLLLTNPPAFTRMRSAYGAVPDIMTVGDFYRGLIGYPEGPKEIQEWRRIPEENLAMAVNGEVFIDNAGAFTAVRQRLLGYYPEDLRLKKLAARCMAIAQTGQYNADRCFRRRDYVTLRTVLTRFTDNVTAAVFLLNRVYKPYYKWAFKRMSGLPVLGAELTPLLTELALSPLDDSAAFEKIQMTNEAICRHLAGVLKNQNLVTTDDWFFTTHAEEIQRKIQDPFLRSLPTQYE